MEALSSAFGIGIEPRELTWLQVSLRGALIFLAALVMVRLADKRFLSKKTAFDVILGFVLASMLARAINGSAALLPTLAGGFVLVGLHRLIAAIAFRWHVFGSLVKGCDDLLVKDGQIQWAGMKKNAVSERDLLENLRLGAHIESVAQVECARMERSGDISVIPKKN